MVKFQSGNVLSEEEAEARIHQEGYESIRWYDVPGATYPRHRHEYDECIWVLKGVIIFTVEDQDYELKAGDKLYLTAGTPHTARVPKDAGVTYLVGQKNERSLKR